MSRSRLQVTRSAATASSRWAQCCLDAVLRLTVPIELPALAAAMRVNLAELAPAARHLLLDLSAPPADDTQPLSAFDLLEPDSIPLAIAADSELWQAMRWHKPVDPAPSGPRSELTLPITDAGQVVALLVCRDLRRLECETAWLVKLALIYRNQVRLLRRNEKDPLTGLYNRQAFDARLKTTVQTADRRDRVGRQVDCPGCFALIDVDYFKSVNDKYGHLFGDEILMLITRLMTQSFRMEDLLFRYGGEEFAVLLTGARLADAQQALERFRVGVEQHAFPQVGRKTVSIGVVAIQAGDTVENVVARADKALYHAKNHGRNRVACYESLLAAGDLTPVTVATGDIELF